MAQPTRIRDISKTATSAASDDYLVLDGATNGTRKIAKANVASAEISAAISTHNADAAAHDYTLGRKIRTNDTAISRLDAIAGFPMLSLSYIGVGYASVHTLWGATAGECHSTLTISGGTGRWDGWETAGAFTLGLPQSGIGQHDWSQWFGIELAFQLDLAASPTSGDGMSALFPASRVSNGNTLTARGVGFKAQWDGSKTALYLVQHNGTSLTSTKLAVNLSATGDCLHRIRAVFGNGSAYIWVDGAFAGGAAVGPQNAAGVFDSLVGNWRIMATSEGGAVTMKNYPPMLLSLNEPATPETLAFLWLGQSNAVGEDYTSSYPMDGLAADCGKSGTWNVDASCSPSGTGRAVASILDGKSAAAGTNLGAAHISFARRMTQLFPGKRIVVIKHACNGSTLQSEWRKAANQFYPSVIATANTHLTTLRAAGGTIRLAGIYWWQGEGDCDVRAAGYAAAAAAYAANFTQFISDLRVDIDSGAWATVPLVAVRLPSWQPTSEYIDDASHALVRGAIQSVCEADPRCGWLNADALPDNGDHIHTSSDGRTTIGIAAAEKLASLMAI